MTDSSQTAAKKKYCFMFGYQYYLGFIAIHDATVATEDYGPCRHVNGKFEKRRARINQVDYGISPIGRTTDRQFFSNSLPWRRIILSHRWRLRDEIYFTPTMPFSMAYLVRPAAL